MCQNISHGLRNLDSGGLYLFTSCSNLNISKSQRLYNEITFIFAFFYILLLMFGACTLLETLKLVFRSNGKRNSLRTRLYITINIMLGSSALAIRAILIQFYFGKRPAESDLSSILFSLEALVTIKDCCWFNSLVILSFLLSTSLRNFMGVRYYSWVSWGKALVLMVVVFLLSCLNGYFLAVIDNDTAKSVCTLQKVSRLGAEETHTWIKYARLTLYAPCSYFT